MELDITSKIKNLQLFEKSAISLGKLESDYVLDFAVQPSCSDEILAATSSNYNIRLYSRKDLANIGCIKGHTDVVTGVTFGKTESNLLYSSSQDESIRCWDLRVGLDKEVQTFNGPEGGCVKLTCVDVDCTEKLVTAGTEDVDDAAFILFWDRRQAEILGCYRESHQTDITQVKFHPSDKDRLISSCDDGLVCIFDVSQTSEDDALLYTFNSECSVNCVGWYGKSLTSVYCLTSIDTFHLWDTLEGDEQRKLTDLKEKFEQSATPVDYFVDVLSTDDSERLVLVGGTYGGELRLVDVSGDEASIVGNLVGGHRDRIRCCHWDLQDGSLVTGGEDSLLCLWSSKPVVSSSMDSGKGKVKVKRKGRKSGPY